MKQKELDKQNKELHTLEGKTVKTITFDGYIFDIIFTDGTQLNVCEARTDAELNTAVYNL